MNVYEHLLIRHPESNIYKAPSCLTVDTLELKHDGEGKHCISFSFPVSEESDMSIEDKTNPNLVDLIKGLKDQAREEDASIWRDVAERLESPSKNWAEVNLSSIQRNAEDGETIVIPGKVLGAGRLEKNVTIGTFKASKSAEKSIEEAGGECIAISELADRMPEGTGIKIMG